METARNNHLQHLLGSPKKFAHELKENSLKTFYRWAKPYGIAPPPENVTLFLTSQCNLRCRMCAQYGESGVSYEQPKNLLSVDVARSVVEELAAYKTKFTLMGGEPLLHPQWLDIARIIKQAGCECSVITNGVTLNRYAEAVCEMGMNCVNISIDGIGEVHDLIRGVPGTWERVIRGLDALLEHKAKNGGGPWISLFYTITQHNYDKLVQFTEWAQAKGVNSIIFFHLRFYSPEDYSENAQYMRDYLEQTAVCQEGFVFDPGHIDTDVLIGQVQEIRSRQWSLIAQMMPDHAIEDYHEYYHTSQYRRPAASSCNVPWSNAVIAPTNMLAPCMDFLCGNLLETPFLKLWNGPRFRQFRRVIHKTKRFPVCHRCCV